MIFTSVLLFVQVLILVNYRTYLLQEAKNKIRDKSFIMGAWVDFENKDLNTQINEYIKSQEDSLSIVLYDLQGNFLARSFNHKGTSGLPDNVRQEVAQIDDAVLYDNPDGSHIIAVNNLYNGSAKAGYVQVLKSLSSVYVPYYKLLRITLAACLAGLFAIAVAGWFFMNQMLTPVKVITEKASAINTEKLESERIPVQNPNDELGKLSITINNLLNRLEQSFKNHRRFVSDAAHELRTPLAIMKGQLEVAALKRSFSQELITKNLDEVNHLINLINSLLLLARSDAGEMKLLRTSFGIVHLSEQVMVSLQEKAIAKNILIEVDGNEIQLSADVDLWRSVLFNLIDNAIKYNRPGGKVWVNAFKEGNKNYITIKDTGTGIHPDHLHHIFDRFYRESNEQNQHVSGIGIGLSLVKVILEIHGSTIDVKSSDEGTIVTVLLPGTL
jgi:signal transduction histidine kinase